MALGSLPRISAYGAAVAAVIYLGSYSGKVVQQLDCHYVQNISIFQNRVDSGVHESSSFILFMSPCLSLGSGVSRRRWAETDGSGCHGTCHIRAVNGEEEARGHGLSPQGPLEGPWGRRGAPHTGVTPTHPLQSNCSWMWPELALAFAYMVTSPAEVPSLPAHP